MTIHSKFLFIAALGGGLLETAEVINNSCAVWQQEFMLLGILALLALVARGHAILTSLAAVVVIGFYAWEGYEQFVVGETCSPFASQLNLLLAATLLAAAGLALGHQLHNKKSTK